MVISPAKTHSSVFVRPWLGYSLQGETKLGLAMRTLANLVQARRGFEKRCETMHAATRRHVAVRSLAWQCTANEKGEGENRGVMPRTVFMMLVLWDRGAAKHDASVRGIAGLGKAMHSNQSKRRGR